jgi:hypothetical protein
MDFVDQYGTSSTSQPTFPTTSTPRHHHRVSAPAPAPAHVAAPAPAPVHVAVHAAPARRPAQRHIAAGSAATRRPAPATRPARHEVVEPALVVAPVSTAATVATRSTTLASATHPGGTPIGHLAIVGVAAGLLLAYAPLSLAVRARRAPAAV